MKRIFFLSTAILLIANLLCGLLLSGYAWANVLLTSGVIIVTTLFVWLTGALRLRDGFKFALYVLHPFFGLAELILAFLSPARRADNGVLVALIVCLAVQSILLVAAAVVSLKTK